jgi:uncharacterized membrane protein YdfJ with MMPL/SSD domain
VRHEGSVPRQDRRARRTRWGLRAGLAAVLVAWLVLDAIGGPTVGRLSEVQENDNANFLPKQAESILVYDESAKFVDSKALPYFVVIERDSGITPADQDECAGVQPHLRFPGADPSIPLYAFVFLVALGIDYSIFLMTRVREESIEHGTRPGIPTCSHQSEHVNAIADAKRPETRARRISKAVAMISPELDRAVARAVSSVRFATSSLAST